MIISYVDVRGRGLGPEVEEGGFFFGYVNNDIVNRGDIYQGPTLTGVPIPYVPENSCSRMEPRSLFAWFP